MRTVIDGAAQYEHGLIRARTRAVLAVKRARGERVGAIPSASPWTPTACDSWPRARAGDDRAGSRASRVRAVASGRRLAARHRGTSQPHGAGVPRAPDREDACPPRSQGADAGVRPLVRSARKRRANVTVWQRAPKNTTQPAHGGTRTVVVRRVPAIESGPRQIPRSRPCSSEYFAIESTCYAAMALRHAPVTPHFPYSISPLCDA